MNTPNRPDVTDWANDFDPYHPEYLTPFGKISARVAVQSHTLTVSTGCIYLLSMKTSLP
jgi:hypothetical protein